MTFYFRMNLFLCVVVDPNCPRGDLCDCLLHRRSLIFIEVELQITESFPVTFPEWGFFKR